MLRQGPQNPGNTRDTWGRRTLLVTNPTNPAPHLARFNPKNKDTLVTTGSLGAGRCPVHVSVRFALPIAAGAVDSGAPVLPFIPSTPSTGTVGNGVTLTLVVHRGTDNLAAMTDDKYVMPVGTNNAVVDRVGFDIVTSNFLAIDAELSCPGFTPDPATGLWVETIAVPVDQPSEQDLRLGYRDVVFHTVAASHGPALLAPPRAARRQLFITNTSTDGDLYVMFGDNADANTFVFVLPKNTMARYESPIGTFTGIIWGTWIGGAPDGKAVITEGLNRQ
jgi:hypothetical protein